MVTRLCQHCVFIMFEVAMSFLTNVATVVIPPGDRPLGVGG